MHSKIVLSDKATAKTITVGDTVISYFYADAAHVYRTVTKVENGVNTETAVRIWADNGGMCECCNRPLSRAIDGVDGSWFIPVLKVNK